MPFIAIMTAFCHHSKTSKNHTIRNLTDDEPTTASLPAHDTCSVSLIPEYSNGYSPPSLQKPFNLSEPYMLCCSYNILTQVCLILSQLQLTLYQLLDHCVLHVTLLHGPLRTPHAQSLFTYWKHQTNQV